MTDAVLFWTIAVIVTGFVLLALVPSLLGRGGQVKRRRDSAGALYREQMARIDADLAAERISADEAEAARITAGRQTLRASEGGSARPTGTGRRRWSSLSWAAGVVVVAPAAAVALYLTVGQPDLPDQPLSGRKDVADAAQLRTAAETLVNEMTMAVEQNPRDLRSWVMLARALTTLGRLDEAVGAYANAIALAPDAADINAAYGEVLVRQADGQVTDQAAEAFRAALTQVPDDPRARYYMALLHYQRGNLRDALAAWRSLEADSPPTAGWMDAVRNRIAETEAAIGTEYGALADADIAALAEQELAEEAPAELAQTETAPDLDDAGNESATRAMSTGAAFDAAPEDAAEAADDAAVRPQPEMAMPTAPQLSEAQVQDMMALTDEQRAARIDGMVGGLAARLEQNPEDVDGWMLLARSYIQLGHIDGAREALANASHYGPGRIDAQSAYARIMLEGQPLDAPVPDEAIAAFERVVAEDPTHPDALWFLGLAAAQQRNFDSARGYWTRLLDTLDPESEAYVDVQSYIAALSGVSGATTSSEPPVDSTNAIEPADSASDTE